VLKSVVQDQDIDGEFIDGQPAGDGPFRTGDHGNAGKAGRHQCRFISAFRRGKEDLPSVGYHVAAAGPAAAVTAAQDGGTEPPGQQSPGNKDGHGSLSRPAHGDVADADDRTGKAFGPDGAGVIAAVSQRRRRSVGPRRGDHCQQQGPAPAAGIPAVP